MLALVAFCARVAKHRRAEPEDIALAMGLCGLLVVSFFFDLPYWSQAAVLMYGMAGVLSVRGRP